MSAVTEFMSQQFPVVPVYLGATLDPLPEPTQDSLFHHRFLVASNGIWRQVRTPWLEATYPVCTNDEVQLPFQELTKNVSILFDQATLFGLVAEFAKLAMENLDHEIHQDLFMDHQGNISKGPLDHGGKAYIEYRRSSPKGALFLDLHSHGRIPSYFSKTDDRDDANDLKIAAVVGNFPDQPIFHIRTCLEYGIFIGGNQCYTVAV